MSKYIHQMISGEHSCPEEIEVRSPFDDQKLATVECTSQTGIEQAIQTARNLFEERKSWLPLHERIKILQTSAKIMTEQIGELALLAAQEGGKPLDDSKVEVLRAIDGIHICVETLRTHAGRAIPMSVNEASVGRIAYTNKEPIGLVVAISAFNHPLNLIVHQVAPAVAVGCPVIVKPSEQTPLSCFRFVEILREAGLPDEWCQPLVVKDVTLAELLVTNPHVAFLSFIGSAKVGWMLRSKLAPGARCALEHGGAAPVIIAEDADTDDAIPLLAKGGFYHAGQVCVSVQRVIAHAAIAREVAEKLAEFGSAMKVGNPAESGTEIGPMISQRELARVQQWINTAIEGGAEILCGNKIILERCLSPTVLFNPPLDSEVSKKEIFGPIICVYPFEDLDSAIDLANNLPFAFQASVFSRNIDTALHASKRLAASAVMINDHTAFRVDWMPFAGLKQSGLGVGGIPYTMEDMQIEKLIVLRSSSLE